MKPLEVDKCLPMRKIPFGTILNKIIFCCVIVPGPLTEKNYLKNYTFPFLDPSPFYSGEERNVKYVPQNKGKSFTNFKYHNNMN